MRMARDEIFLPQALNTYTSLHAVNPPKLCDFVWRLLFGTALRGCGSPRARLQIVLEGEGGELSWVAVKELKLSYYIGQTLLFTIYTHYGTLI